MSMIRKIKRNISQASIGRRCNRYGDDRLRKPGQAPAFSFANYRKHIASYVAGLFKLDEYLKHKPHQKAFARGWINEELSG